MSETSVDSRDQATILVHYYRAMVGRADVWRMRMDTTTNWAIGATAGIISFSLGNPATPHFVVHIAVLLTFGFLLLEARRLTFYHLWQQRVLLLETDWIRPALGGEVARDKIVSQLSENLEPYLGTTVPEMPLAKAVARRLRRIYLYLFAVQFGAWGLKLSIHPTETGRFADVIERAKFGALPGEACVGIVVGIFLALFALAVLRGAVEATSAR